MAVIGAGAIARDHVTALAGVPGIRLVHVVDRHPERASALAALAEGATWSTEPATAWCDDIDVTTVCTSPESHADLSVAALGAGRAVLLEKPAALGMADADRILAAGTPGTCGPEAGGAGSWTPPAPEAMSPTTACTHSTC
ncbi:Gfo/Idh/MocA family protein [Streptomyces sp. NPDC004980]